MVPHLFLSSLFLAIGIFALWVAYRKGFFHFSYEKRLIVSGVTFLGLVAVFALYFGLQLALGVGAIRLFGSFTVQSGGWAHIAIFGIAFSTLLVFRGRLFLKGPLRPHVKIGMLTFLLAYPLAQSFGQLGEGIVHLLGGTEGEQMAVNQLRQQLNYPPLFALSTLMVAVAVPIGEEILFRGALQGWLRKKMGPLFAIGTSSLIFTFVHLSSGQGWANLTLVLVLIPLSLCLGYLYERQRSLWAPIALHGVFNGVNVLALCLKSF